jgi:putative tricarboxylic transport membrane protein
LRQDVAAGLFLVAVAVFTWIAGADLATGTLRAIGPGMLPKALATIVGLLGLAILISGALDADGSPLDRWHLRGPVCVLGAVVVFALTIRTLGLAIAGPLSVLIGSFASPEVKPVESLVFAAVLTAGCIVLFKTLLGLPIPVLAF